MKTVLTVTLPLNTILRKLGILRDKTRILITHQLQFVSNANLIVVLKEGKVTEIGAYNTLMDANGDFANLIKTHVKESHKSEEESSEATSTTTSTTDKKPAAKVPTYSPTILTFSGTFYCR